MTRAPIRSRSSGQSSDAERQPERTVPARDPFEGSSITPTQRQRLAVLLAETSRTFALSVPLLAEPLRTEVTIAYLLFRIADTIEDEVDWSNTDRARALNIFTTLVSDPEFHAVSPELITTLASVDLSHPGYARLLADTVFVLDAFAALDDAPRDAIARHLTRTADGMALQLESGIPPGTIDGAREYCYTVAGIVGELCTELFAHRNVGLDAVRADLMALAPAFGEGLQLVNILRDEIDDADAGRRYIPNADARPALIRLAAGDLHDASRYVRALETNGAHSGTVAFNALNIALAYETLALVNNVGPGAKLTRDRVAELFASMRDASENGAQISPLLERSAACLPESLAG